MVRQMTDACGRIRDAVGRLNSISRVEATTPAGGFAHARHRPLLRAAGSRLRAARAHAVPLARSVRGPLYYGWVVVAGAFLVLFLAYGTQYAFGVFAASWRNSTGRAPVSPAPSRSTPSSTAPSDWWRAASLTAGAPRGHRRGRRAPRRRAGRHEPRGRPVAALRPLRRVAALGMSTAFVPATPPWCGGSLRRRGLAVGWPPPGAVSAPSSCLRWRTGS